LDFLFVSFLLPEEPGYPNCYHWCTYSGQNVHGGTCYLWTLSMELHDTLLAPRILRWRRYCVAYMVYSIFGSGDCFIFYADPPDRLWGPQSLPIQWPPGALFPVVRRPEREADHWPPPSAKVNNEWSYTSSPPPSMCPYGVRLAFTFIYLNLSFGAESFVCYPKIEALRYTELQFCLLFVWV
jgi:hypothetical protein